MTVFARGLLNRLFTRAYLPDDTGALAADPLLSSLDPERRETLVAARRTSTATSSTSGCRARARPCSSPTRGTQTEPMTRPPLARRRARRRPPHRRGVPARRWSRSRRRGSRRSSTAGIAPAAAALDDLAGLVADDDAGGIAPRRRGGGNPVIPLVGAAARAARRTHAGRGPLAAPRPDQPGRGRHRADDRRPRRGRRRPRRAARRRSARSPSWSRRTGDTPMVGPHADPARRPDHVRAQGRPVADRRPRRVRRPGGRWSSRSRSAARPAPWPPPSSWPAPRPTRSGRHRPRPSTWPPASGSPRRPPWHTTRTPVTRLGDAAGPLHRRLGPARQRRAHPEPARDRRAVRGRRRRVVDDAAQGEPGAVGAGPPRRAGRARSSRRRCTSPPPSRVDERADGAWHAEWATLRDLLRRTVVAGVPDQRAARRAQGGRRPDGDHAWPTRATTYGPSSGAWPTWPARRPAATTSAPPTRSSRRRWPGPPAYSRRRPR